MPMSTPGNQRVKFIKYAPYTEFFFLAVQIDTPRFTLLCQSPHPLAVDNFLHCCDVEPQTKNMIAQLSFNSPLINDAVSID